MPFLALALFLLAAPSEPAFRDGFTPHPFAAELKVANGATTMASKGYGNCSKARTTEEPAFAFTVEQPLSDLRLSIDQPAVLVLPDRTFVCVATGSAWLQQWPAGRYQVLLFGPADELTAKLRLDQPVRSQAEVKAALERTPELTLSSSAATNPVLHSLVPPAVFAAHSSGVGCAAETLAPLARLKVPYPSTWDFVEKDGAALVLVPAAGGCLRNLRNARLEAGDYVLWAAPAPGSEKKTWELAIGDESRPLSFGEAPVYDLGQLKKPLALAGKTSDRSWGPMRQTACPGLPRSPSFYVKGAEGLKNVELWLWRDGGLGDQARFQVYGPLEDPETATRPMRCDLARPTFRTLRGTYAVFVTGGDKPSQDVLALAHRVDLATDYLAAPVPVPESPSVAERALSNYFPFFRESLDARRFFLGAPKQLFVATNGGNTPALVITARELTLDVLALDGSVQTVGASELAPVAKAPKLPATLPAPTPVTTVEEAIGASGPAEAGFVAQYHAVESAVNGCVAAWLAKNDPEWAAGEEVFRLTTSEFKGARVATKADQACNAKRLEPAAKRLVQQVNASRAKNAKSFLAALKKRFK